MTVVVVCFVLILLIDLIPLLRRRPKRGILAFLLLWLPALTLAVLYAIGVKVPSTMLVLGELLKSIGLSY